LGQGEEEVAGPREGEGGGLVEEGEKKMVFFSFSISMNSRKIQRDLG
jgi:hypothetical protein